MAFSSSQRHIQSSALHFQLIFLWNPFCLFIFSFEPQVLRVFSTAAETSAFACFFFLHKATILTPQKNKFVLLGCAWCSFVRKALSPNCTIQSSAEHHLDSMHETASTREGLREKRILICFLSSEEIKNLE